MYGTERYTGRQAGRQEEYRLMGRGGRGRSEKRRGIEKYSASNAWRVLARSSTGRAKKIARTSSTRNATVTHTHTSARRMKTRNRIHQLISLSQRAPRSIPRSIHDAVGFVSVDGGHFVRLGCGTSKCPTHKKRCARCFTQDAAKECSSSRRLKRPEDDRPVSSPTTINENGRDGRSVHFYRSCGALWKAEVYRS